MYLRLHSVCLRRVLSRDNARLIAACLDIIQLKYGADIVLSHVVFNIVCKTFTTTTPVAYDELCLFSALYIGRYIPSGLTVVQIRDVVRRSVLHRRRMSPAVDYVSAAAEDDEEKDIANLDASGWSLV